MNKALRIGSRLVICLLLSGSLTMAQSAGKSDRTKAKDSHGKLSKVAFWRHHKDAGDKSKASQPKHESKKATKPAKAQVKSASVKSSDKKIEPKSQSEAAKKSAQAKQAKSSKPAVKKEQKQKQSKSVKPGVKKEQKPEQHASNGTKPVKKASVVTASKKGDKAPAPKQASVKQ